nr:hypothetical protein [Tanacetum cinerariifolium]
MTRSTTKELTIPFENPKSAFRSKKRLFETPGLVESSSPELDLFSSIKEHSKEETTRIMMKTMEQYMSKTRGNYGSGVVRPKINDKTHFELKRQHLKKLCENTFNGSEHEDANEHIEKFLEIVDLFHIPKVTQDEVMLRVFPMSLTEAAIRWLRNEPSGSIIKWETLKMKFLNKTSSKTRSTETFDGLATIQAQLNNLKREIKKVNEKVYAAQADYPTDGGDGDDEPSDDDNEDNDDEDPEEEPFEEDEEEEEEHPALADSPAVLTVDLVLSTREAEALEANEPIHAPGSPISIPLS